MSEPYPLPQATRYVPLLPRVRPPALPPRLRLTEIEDLTTTAAHAQQAGTGLINAAEAMNKAALTASDTGHPALAHELCLQQFDRFAAAAPLPGWAAKLALQPLVNLGRLHIRAGTPGEALRSFEALYHSATGAGPAQLGRRTCAVDGLTSAADLTEVRRFLWTILLADGTRALCSTGDYQNAVAHLRRYNGIGKRMLDGRQAAVVAAVQCRDPATALDLLDDATISEPWEEAVSACLTTLCTQAANRDPTGAIVAMAQTLPRLSPAAPVFAVRVGVLACELAPHHRALVDRLISTGLAADDARCADALLDSPTVQAALSTRQRATLRQRTNRAHISATAPPGSVTEQLRAACDAAATHIDRHLAALRGHSRDERANR